MAADAVLGMLGLARRAGKLAGGEDLVREMVASGKCRAIFLASDIGDATRRKVMRHAERVPIFQLSCERITLGDAIAVQGCAVCALNDIGMAHAIAQKLVDTGAENAAAAARVAEKKTHIDRRKGKKKKKQTEKRL